MTGDIIPQTMGARRHLRHVPQQPRPSWHLEVRISAADGRYPYGRTKIFRLSGRDFAQLVDVAHRLESRR